LRSGRQEFDPDKADEEGFNEQNIPEMIRQIYIADEGCLLGELDGAQIEWIFMMLLARCERGVEAYLNERDIHTENAQEIVVPTLLSEDWEALDRNERKDRRRSTKSFTHGLDYGEGDPNLARRFGVPRKISRQARLAYFERWPEILEWHKDVEDFVVQHRYLQNPFGRKRRFLDVTTKRVQGKRELCLDRKQLKEALAFGPASTNADHWKIALRGLWDAGIRILTGTHDSFLIQFPEDQVDKVVKRGIEICEEEIPELAEFNGGKPFRPRYEANVGLNWSPWSEENPDGVKEWEAKDDSSAVA
jgi:DNA polymerase-1